MKRMKITIYFNKINLAKRLLFVTILPLWILWCSGDVFHKYEIDRGDNSVPYIPTTEPPIISSAVAIAKDKLLVTFNEEVEETSATDYKNYHIQGLNRVNVLGDPAPVLSEDKKSVLLTLSTGLTYGMHTGREYTLLVQRVKDLDGNAILNALATFIGLGSVVAEVWNGNTKMPITPPYPALNTQTVEFTIKILGGGTAGSYSYSLDGSPFSAEIDISEPLVLPNLSEGYHTLKVVGKHAETGEWQELNQATEINFLIDTTPPVAQLSYTPPTVTASRDIAVLVTGNDVATYTYRINGGSISEELPVSKAIVHKNLPDGEYTLYVWGKDAAGNQQVNPTTYTWVVSTSKPTAVLLNKPDRYTRLRFATFVIGGTDVNYYRYKLNNGEWSGYESVATNIELKNLPDGDYTISVIGASRPGDPTSEGLPVSYTWTVDNVAPECTIENLPSNPTNNQKVNIVVSSNAGDVVTYKYRLIINGVPQSLSGTYSISDPITLNSLSEGTYTIKVMGIDAAGNMQSEEKATEWSWTVDLTAPKVTLSNLPNANTNVNYIDVGVGPTNDVVSYKYILNDVIWSSEIPVLTNINRANLTDGTYTLLVVGRDKAGNWQSIQDPTRHVWTVDTVPPVVTLSNKPPSITKNPDADFVVGGSGVVRYRYRLNGGNWSEELDRYMVPSIQLFSLADGDYTLEVIGVDLAGNWQIEPTSHSWKVDSTYVAPTATLSNLPANPTNEKSISINVGSVVSYKYRLDGNDWSNEILADTPIEHTGLVDGEHTLLVIGKNEYEVWQSISEATEYKWIVDTVPPLAELSNRPSSPTNVNNISIVVSGIGVSSYKYSFNNPDPRGGTEYPVTVPISMNNIPDGTHTIYVIAKDEAGNWQDWQQPTTCTWTIDTSVPTAEFVTNTLPKSITNVTEINILITGGGVVTYKYKLDGATSWSPELPISTAITRIGLSEGSHSVSVIGKNTTGTWQSESSPTTYTWEIDLTPPSPSDIVLGNLPANPTSQTSIDISVGGTTLAYYRYKLDSESWSASIPIGTNIQRSDLLPITHTIQVIACDIAGNWIPYESARSYTWLIDTTNPIAEILNPPDNPTNKTSVSLNIGGANINEYKYSFNGGAWSPWTSISEPISLSGLADQSHTIRVCGKTGSGIEQSEANATTYSWTVDTQAPVATLSDLPSNPTTSTTASIKVSGTDVIGYRYRLDGGEWQPVGSEYNVNSRIELSLSIGLHTIEVIGRDLAGNWQTSPTSYSWTINEPELISPKTYDAGDYTTSSTITFSWMRPMGTGDVKIQIASDSNFNNIVYGGTSGAVIGNIDSYEFTVTSTEIQTYYARVSVNRNSGLPADDPSWKAWGEASNGITVTGGIVGTVLNGVTRNPISGATVELRRMSDNFLVASTTTDSNGEFAFVGIGIGTNYYKAVVSMTGYYSTQRNNITVVLGETTNIGISYLVPTSASSGTITGRSIDANTAEKLQNTKVEVFSWENQLMDTKYTNSSGDFTTAPLSPGVYTVKFTRPNYYDLVVDNVIVNGNKNIGRQAICPYLIEPQVRVIVLWGAVPEDLDLHVVGPSAKTVTELQGGGPENRFHVGYIGVIGYGWQYNFNEATGTYEWSNPDRDGTRSTTALVQDVYPGNPLTGAGYGPEAINLWRYGGVQYARGVYTYTVRNYSRTDWYAGGQNITMRVYDSIGMRREVIMPTGANDPANTTRDWKALKINIQGNTREKRYLYVPSQNVFYNAGNNYSKPGFDW